MSSSASGLAPTPTMSAELVRLLDVLALERDGPLAFSGRSLSQGLTKIFGGQLAAQGLSATQQTVADDKTAHSLHAQFVNAGRPDQPLTISVERVRDARAFSTRRATIEQEGRPLCFVTVSFHIDEPGAQHQRAFMPSVAEPDDLDNEAAICERYLAGLPEVVRAVLPDSVLESVLGQRALELRPVLHFSDPIAPDKLDAAQDIWFRSTGALPVDDDVHQRVLTFASDFHFLGTAMRPHGMTMLTPGVSVATLQHSMTFHHAAQCDEWLLHSMDSPSSGGGLGFSRGQWFSADGRLLASTSQEALIRDKRLRAQSSSV